jgi:hypothetical protein
LPIFRQDHQGERPPSVILASYDMHEISCILAVKKLIINQDCLDKEAFLSDGTTETANYWLKRYDWYGFNEGLG